MAKLKALVTAEVVKDVLEKSFHEEIEFVYDGYCLNHNVMPHTELAEKIKDVEILICEYDTISSDIFDVAKTYLPAIAKDLVGRSLPADTLWNVNFPGCSVEECKGILENRVPANHQLYLDNYDRKEDTEDGFILQVRGIQTTEAAQGTDVRAVLDRYISIGTITNGILSGAIKE